MCHRKLGSKKPEYPYTASYPKYQYPSSCKLSRISVKRFLFEKKKRVVFGTKVNEIMASTFFHPASVWTFIHQNMPFKFNE